MKETEEPAEPTTPTQSTSESATPTPTSNESGSTYKGNRRGKSRRGNESGTRGLEQKYFKGETPELNAVLGLITERLDQGVTFEKFQYVLKNYVLKNFHKAEDIVEMVTNLKDPCTNFETKNIPKDLTTTEEGSKINMKMWEIRVKKYMDTEEVLTENSNKLYGIVIVKCTPPLRPTIKHDAEYGIK